MEENVIQKNTNTKENKKNKSKNKLRMILVIVFILIFLCISYISLRGSYLEYKELGENYEDVFFTNIKYKYSIIGISFLILYLIVYFTNRGIKKGLKPFFEKENLLMPKLPNKSIALISSAIASVFIGNSILQKVLLYVGNTSFGITDPIFNMDIAYYMFQKPLIEEIIFDILILIVFLTIYSAIYYIIVFNRYFEGIDGAMLKSSLFLKKVVRNIKLLAIFFAALTILNTQNILFGDMMTIDEDTQIVGAGYTESTVKLWGYVLFAIVIVFSVFKAANCLAKGNIKKIVKNILIIPAYLVILFVVMVGFDFMFVNSNELDKEKEYLQYNISNTKNAYNINIEEKNLDYTGTITQAEVNSEQDTINNIAIISEDAVLKTLKSNQTETGYYSYRSANIAKYKIDGSEKLVYVSPREVTSKGRTYNNKTFEYTHGNGQVITSATTADSETGSIEYIQKDITGEDNVIEVTESKMYFGLEVEDMIATNVKNKQEYDYTDEEGNEVTTEYTGEAGLNLNFFDKLVLGISKGNLNLAFSGDVTEESKILVNRNVIKRAQKALPYLIYDEEPYTVVNSEGRIIWVIDAYTTSSNYPYSQYTTIEHDNVKENINYIRNSVKVLIDSYDGTISYYITDRTDPIAMAYRKIYPTLFKDLDEEIPEDISSHFVYPEYLYEVQAEMLQIYHNVKPDVLYREDDIWEIAKFNSTTSSKSTGTQMDPVYTMVKTVDDESDLGLVQVYNPKDKQNTISYLVGKTKQGSNELTLYKFSEDSNVVGTMQLDKQIEQDEAISAELEAINTTGTKITKKMVVVPINNTILYVEPIYQTLLNESDIPVLKKVIVASGNKVAIGDNTSQALQKLLSQYAVDIEVDDTDDIDGLIDAIIKANNNLTESNDSNDWEMMGKDIEKLQSLITSLEKLKEEQDAEEEKQKETTTDSEEDENSNNITNTTNESDENNNTETNNSVE